VGRSLGLRLSSAPTDLLLSVIEQVVFQGIWQREAQDLLTKEVHWSGWLRVRRRGSVLLPLLLFQVLTAVVVGWAGDPTGKYLLVQKDDRFHATAAHSPSLGPGSVLQSISTAAHCFLTDDLFNGAPDGDPSQILEAPHGQGRPADRLKHVPTRRPQGGKGPMTLQEPSGPVVLATQSLCETSPPSRINSLSWESSAFNGMTSNDSCRFKRRQK